MDFLKIRKAASAVKKRIGDRTRQVRRQRLRLGQKEADQKKLDNGQTHHSVTNMKHPRHLKSPMMLAMLPILVAQVSQKGGRSSLTILSSS